MDYVALYFAFLLTATGTEPTGYIPAVDVRNPPCGIAGTVVGITYDRPRNPTAVYWPDPYFPGAHCRVDVRDRVAVLEPGTYEFATTEMGVERPFGTPVIPYIGIDPHVSPTFTVDRSPGAPTAPSAPYIQGGVDAGKARTVPALKMLSWDANDASEGVVAYMVTVNGTRLGDTDGLTMPITFPSFGIYNLAVMAINNKAEISIPATLNYTLVQDVPQCLRPTIRVEDWTRTVAIGARGRVLMALMHSAAITKLQVKLGGQVIGEVNGTDLRDLSGLYFSVPRTAGTYNITIAATDVLGCSEQTTAVREVVVQ